MSLPSYELKGKGKTGVLLPRMGAPRLAEITKLPTKVKLGRKPPEFACSAPQFEEFLDPAKASVPPESVNWATKASASLGQMLGNDEYGDCVIAGKMHAVGCWTANDSDSSGEAVGTRDEAVRQYRDICGPGDNGCVIEDVLEHMIRTGLSVGGSNHKLDGFARVKWSDVIAAKVAIHYFGGLGVGINLPSKWLESDVWDVTDSPIVGGHDVEAVWYARDGVYVSSWGRVYRITWRAWSDPRFLEEAHVKLGPDWYGRDKLSASGLDVTGLRDALAVFGGGGVPDDPQPQPVPPEPPVPPTPSGGVYDLSGEITTDRRGHPSGFRGTATPRAGGGYPDEMSVDAGGPVLASMLHDILEHCPGCVCGLRGGHVTIRRGKLTPEQWQQLIAAILQMLAVILPLFSVPDSVGDLNRQSD